MRQQGIDGWNAVRAGSCRAWVLPPDETCAAAARRLLKDGVAELRLEPETLDDAVLMASELAANTLHASSELSRPELCHPELWLYLRGVGLGRELVCKVFDCYRGWLHGPPPSRIGAALISDVAGRGLQIVHELSRGRWGRHPTRARLGGWGLRGKAVWFAVPAPLAHARLADVTGLRTYTRSADVSAARRYEQISAVAAARELQEMLDERGFGGSALVRSDSPGADVSVLSVRRGLTLWCRSGSVSLTGPGGYRERWGYADLVEVTEQTIWRYEELDTGQPDALITA
jgi:hypothetical protein